MTYDEIVEKLKRIQLTGYYVGTIECDITIQDNINLNNLFDGEAIQYIKNNFRKVKAISVGPSVPHIISSNQYDIKSTIIDNEFWASKILSEEKFTLEGVDYFVYIDINLIKLDKLTSLSIFEKRGDKFILNPEFLGRFSMAQLNT